MLSTVFLVRPEEFESPTSRLRRPVFYPVELETRCLALEVTVEGDVTYHWLGCARPRLTQGYVGAASRLRSWFLGFSVRRYDHIS